MRQKERVGKAKSFTKFTDGIITPGAISTVLPAGEAATRAIVLSVSMDTFIMFVRAKAKNSCLGCPEHV
jgi:hypothetical protein